MHELQAPRTLSNHTQKGKHSIQTHFCTSDRFNCADWIQTDAQVTTTTGEKTGLHKLKLFCTHGTCWIHAELHMTWDI